jgi:hypothetical protein
MKLFKKLPLSNLVIKPREAGQSRIENAATLPLDHPLADPWLHPIDRTWKEMGDVLNRDYPTPERALAIYNSAMDRLKVFKSKWLTGETRDSQKPNADDKGRRSEEILAKISPEHQGTVREVLSKMQQWPTILSQDEESDSIAIDGKSVPRSSFSRLISNAFSTNGVWNLSGNEDFARALVRMGISPSSVPNRWVSGRMKTIASPPDSSIQPLVGKRRRGRPKRVQEGRNKHGSSNWKKLKPRSVAAASLLRRWKPY